MVRRTRNLPARFALQECVKPRKLKVSGFRFPSKRRLSSECIYDGYRLSRFFEVSARKRFPFRRAYLNPEMCVAVLLNTPAGPMKLFRSSSSIVVGLPHNSGGSAPAFSVSGPAQRSPSLRPARSLSRLKRPFPSEASAASLLPPLLRLLPGGANQFPGGTFTRCGPAPFHGSKWSI